VKDNYNASAAPKYITRAELATNPQYYEVNSTECQSTGESTGGTTGGVTANATTQVCAQDKYAASESFVWIDSSLLVSQSGRYVRADGRCTGTGGSSGGTTEATQNTPGGSTVGAATQNTANQKCIEEFPGQPILCNRATQTTYDDEGQWTCTDNVRRVDSQFKGKEIALSSCQSLQTTNPSNPTTGASVTASPGALLQPNTSLVAPVVAAQPTTVQYQNKVSFTAYRESTLETSGVVPVGAVKFSIRHYPSAGVANAPTLSSLSTNVGGVNITRSIDGRECAAYLGIVQKTLSTITNLFTRPAQEFVTPDSGGQMIPTQTVNMAPGFYIIQYSKNLFNSGGKAICFQLGANEGLNNDANINALLYAEKGAEPPGISAGRIQQNTNQSGQQTGTGVQFLQYTDGTEAHRVYVNGGEYKYLALWPYKGWQPAGNYQFGEPNNTQTQSGLTVLQNPTWIPGIGNVQNYLSQCQNFGITLNLGSMSRETVGGIGGFFALIDGLRDNADALSIAGRTLAGFGGGYLLGSATEGTNTNISINFGQMNQNCQALYNSQIPATCQQCFVNGVYNSANCPSNCVTSNPLIQQMLQSGGIRL
jgi:hypothetical protein